MKNGSSCWQHLHLHVLMANTNSSGGTEKQTEVDTINRGSKEGPRAAVTIWFPISLPIVTTNSNSAISRRLVVRSTMSGTAKEIMRL